LHVSESSQENDEAQAMDVFLADARTQHLLQHVRGGGGRDDTPVMDETPPRESRLLRYLLDERRQSERRDGW
jgi:hypothetical protein